MSCLPCPGDGENRLALHLDLLAGALEIYGEPVADASAASGWRYRSVAR
jgi:hypothetical protein